MVRLESAEERSRKLKAKLGQEYLPLRELYRQLGRGLDKLDETIPKLYEVYRGDLQKAVVFGQYMR